MSKRPRTAVPTPSTDKSSDKQPGQTLQTLERGLKALSFISEHERGVSIAELSAHLGVHRAIGYRIATTLENDGFLTRDQNSQLFLGAALLALAAKYAPQLRLIAAPLLQKLAQETNAAAFISIPDGNTCVAIMVAEPQGQMLRLSYRVGSRHPLSRGAAGIAILSGRPESQDDDPSVIEARQRGYSVTKDQLQVGAVGVATAIPLKNSGPLFEASVGVVAMHGLDVESAAGLVKRCSLAIASAIGTPG